MSAACGGGGEERGAGGRKRTALEVEHVALLRRHERPRHDRPHSHNAAGAGAGAGARGEGSSLSLSHSRSPEPEPEPEEPEPEPQPEPEDRVEGELEWESLPSLTAETSNFTKVELTKARSLGSLAGRGALALERREPYLRKRRYADGT